MNDLHFLLPHAVLVATALIVLLVDALAQSRRLCCLGAASAFGAVAAIVIDWSGPAGVGWGGLLIVDGFTRAFDAIFLGALAIVAIASTSDERRNPHAGEYYALLLLASVGLMLSAAAGSLLMLYAGIELSTISFMGLVGFSKRSRKSAEAALKLLVTGAVASAVSLYGASLVFGIAHGADYSRISSALLHSGGVHAAVAWVGFASVVAGLAFKIAAVPFHMWAPDVYEGAPTPVSAYLSTASKAAGFAAIVRFVVLAMAPAPGIWVPIVMLLCVSSMLVGNLLAVAQKNVKRLLAYSGIGQAGYLLVAVSALGASGSTMAVGAITMYAALYAFTNIAAFLIAQVVSDSCGSEDADGFAGLHKRSPLLAFAMLVVLFSLGGIPPLAGFVGKLYLFAAGWEGGQLGLVVVGAVVSVVGLYYYLMLALQVYIKDPKDARPIATPRPVAVALVICVVAILAIGVYPRPWVELGATAARSSQSGPVRVGR